MHVLGVASWDFYLQRKSVKHKNKREIGSEEWKMLEEKEGKMCQERNEEEWKR